MDNRIMLVLAGRRSCINAAAIRTFGTGIVVCLAALASQAGPGHGWLSWRGPEQSGVSRETGLPDKVSAQEALWVADFPGQSAPVIANGKLYAMGYLGQGPDLQEGVACFDPDSGTKKWQ